MYSSEPQISKFIFLFSFFPPRVSAQTQAYSLKGFDLSKIIGLIYLSYQLYPKEIDVGPVVMVDDKS